MRQQAERLLRHNLRAQVICPKVTYRHVVPSSSTTIIWILPHCAKNNIIACRGVSVNPISEGTSVRTANFDASACGVVAVSEGASWREAALATTMYSSKKRWERVSGTLTNGDTFYGESSLVLTGD